MTHDTTGSKPTPQQPLDLTLFDAVLFDLDGVLTKTAVVHAAAWKRLFDEYLKSKAAGDRTRFRPFDAMADYQQYVDGKLRHEGVKSFLESRGIVLPYGTPQDGPDQETIYGLGNKKDGYFQAHLKEHGVDLYEDAVHFLRAVRAHRLRTAVVSASKHTATVVHTVGLTDDFDVRIDGLESERLHLRSKPAPDAFLEATRRLAVSPQRAIVVEDAVAGVQAGRHGGFGLVIGVDRTGHADELKRNGATLVTSNMAELTA